MTRSGGRTRARVLGVGALLGVLALAQVSAVPSPARAASTPSAPDTGAPVARTVDDVARAWRASAPSSVLLGRSVLGRPILASRQGSADAPYVLLVLGQMHGTETAGRAVVRALRALPAPADVQVWTISTMNPDGAAAGRRTNAHGVDLNRNFPYLWSSRATSRALYFPGTRPVSEPEVVAMMAFLDQLRPDLVVSLHQHYSAVDLGGATRTHVWAQRLSAAMRLRTAVVPCDIGTCTGTMTSWYNHTHPGAAITVELPLRVPATSAGAFARAILSVGAQLVGSTG